MHLLGIMGSPRIGGNTDILLEEALRGARDAGADSEKIILDELSISPCRECGEGSADGRCVVPDDMRIVHEKVDAADAVIVGSPVFFGSVSAQVKIMVDRFQCAWIAAHRHRTQVFGKERECAFICAAASSRRDFFENARAVVRNWCATVRGRCAGDLFCPGVDEKGSVRNHPECLRQAYELGRKLVVRRG